MQARSALFDLYGDYLRARGSRAPVSALVRLLAPLDIAAPAVRTAVSRMVRQGWLHPLRLASGPGYVLTPKAARRLDEAAARVYRIGRGGWDGRFDMILLHEPVPRPEVTRLTYLGYGSLSDQVWVAPRPSDEVEPALREAGVGFDRFSAAHTAGPGIIDRAWDLRRIGQSYEEFTASLHPVVKAITPRSTDEEAYAARFRLVQAWRAVLFADPQLPAALLPPGWPGIKAAGFFDKHAVRLRPAADRHVERCLHDAARGVRVGFSET
ncbi:PaaX family transcriptional regulator [Actinoplanes derwentensis]|uniref:Transcriptional regulator, PaaX family n=1 Tax=Actinoplanes derwentensis TaxID=113562 RepID=A0A1H2D037_9ACTN|nr:PaaX family transcriptional regulator C-terminal domain-containing protein [Actinoplanes derwentensis]GID85907.1 phenylacetic acid degradation operon negative regulatory protein PaaX [Actinoplanes derwentensis]SDT76091.1 transcriptional regulator, PaaX family [Actinoplanes derwentensis]